MHDSTQHQHLVAAVGRARVRAVVAPVCNLMAGSTWSIPTYTDAAFGHKRQPRLRVISP